MFNLESAIAEWRQKMLAAGIATPVPLEELEEHLREEIERQMKSGLDAPRAFEIAIQNTGEARALEGEFRKADTLNVLSHHGIYDAVLTAFTLYLACGTIGMVYLRWVADGLGETGHWREGSIFALVALDFLYIAALMTTLVGRRYRPQSGIRLTRLLNWALLPAVPIGTLIGLYGLWCAEAEKTNPAKKSWWSQLMAFTRPTAADQNILLRIMCSIIVAFIGAGFLRFVFLAAPANFNFRNPDGAFFSIVFFDRSLVYGEVGKLMLGVAVSMLGVAFLIIGLWMFWCAWQIVFGPRIQAKLDPSHV